MRRSNRHKKNYYHKRVQREKYFDPKPTDLLNPLHYYFYKDIYYDPKRRRNLKRPNKKTYSPYRRSNYKNIIHTVNKAFQIHAINPLPGSSFRRLLVCKNRRARRIALFALKQIGKGRGGSFKKRIFTDDSKIKC